MIFDWLTSDTDNKLSILSIVGMGGLGKTTDTEEFDVFNVSRAILDTITNSTDRSRELEMVQRSLKEKLTDKRFLLVLDDVWNENRHKWEAVQNALVYGAQGSRILITTRSKKVASIMGSKEHNLEQLQEQQCEQLFDKHAFRDDNLQRDPECTEIGKQIVKKCKGLPLALKTMGSLLHNKSFVSEWKSVLKSEIWEFSDEHSNIVPALALSYHRLPPHLKKCFAYCALFPKDYEFNKECLIRLWMAEDFLQCRQLSKSSEEIGEQYFNDLLLRSFFQQSWNRISGKFFFMHDLLNDLAKYVCGDICFRWGIDEAKSVPNTTRHILFSTKHYYHGFEFLHDVEKLHTFLPTNGGSVIFKKKWRCWECQQIGEIVIFMIVSIT